MSITGNSILSSTYLIDYQEPITESSMQIFSDNLSLLQLKSTIFAAHYFKI